MGKFLKTENKYIHVLPNLRESKSYNYHMGVLRMIYAFGGGHSGKKNPADWADFRRFYLPGLALPHATRGSRIYAANGHLDYGYIGTYLVSIKTQLLMNKKGAAYFTLDPKLNQFDEGKEIRLGLSAVLRLGTTLWIANDETVSLERLTFQGQEGNDGEAVYKYGEHKKFPLSQYLSLPAPPPAGAEGRAEEADVEGLDYHDGYLWLVGSHSLKRKKADIKASKPENLESLLDVSSDGNRFLLARIPMVEGSDGVYTLERTTGENGTKRTAAQLRGGAKGNDITKELREDELLKDFLRIPGKDNGFDIEGLAVTDDRLLLGLRGPVLRGWAIILELKLKEDSDERPTVLKLKSMKKRFLELGGLGIRDLIIQGSDLLILAGPTMELDGPVVVYRWVGGAGSDAKRFVFKSELILVTEVPYGQGDDQGLDHAEGITLFSSRQDGRDDSIMVVYDAAASGRLFEQAGVKADILSL